MTDNQKAIELLKKVWNNLYALYHWDSLSWSDGTPKNAEYSHIPALIKDVKQALLKPCDPTQAECDQAMADSDTAIMMAHTDKPESQEDTEKVSAYNKKPLEPADGRCKTAEDFEECWLVHPDDDKDCENCVQIRECRGLRSQEPATSEFVKNARFHLSTAKEKEWATTWHFLAKACDRLEDEIKRNETGQKYITAHVEKSLELQAKLEAETNRADEAEKREKAWRDSDAMCVNRLRKAEAEIKQLQAKIAEYENAENKAN